MERAGVKQNGFTIVELLIVIVVIAILAAITIVAYNGIRERANSSAQKSELSQLQRKIQVDVLALNGTPITIKTPIARSVGSSGSTTFSAPLESAQEITLYGVFDTLNNAAASNWSGIISLQPNSTNNAFRLRTGASASTSTRAFFATSAQTNQDLTDSTGILGTTARHIGWVTANATTISAGFDNNPAINAGLAAHTGWNFESVGHASNGSYTSVAALVFPEYHDPQTRAQIIRWLNKEYNVGL